MDSINWLYAYMPISDVSILWPGLIIIGFAVGMYGGGFGTSGSWMVTPGLNILGFPMPFAVGTSICHLAGVSLIFALRHPKADSKVDYKLGLVMLLGVLAGVEAGLHILLYLERLGLAGSTVRWGYLVILVCLLLFAIYEKKVVKYCIKKNKQAEIRDDLFSKSNSTYALPLLPVMCLKYICMRSSIWKGILVSIATGLVAGCLGLGGGLLLLPVLSPPMEIASPIIMSTDILEIAASGLYGAFTFTYHGRVELVAVVILLFGVIAGKLSGNFGAQYISGNLNKKISIALIVVYIAAICLKQNNSHYYSAVFLFCGLVLVSLVPVFRLFYSFGNLLYYKKNRL